MPGMRGMREPVAWLRSDLSVLEEIRPGYAASLERRGLVKIVEDEKRVTA